MRQKIIITISLLLFALVLFLMFTDFFNNTEKVRLTDIDSSYVKMKLVDTSLIKYKEIRFIQHTVSEASGLAVDDQSNIYISGKNIVQIISNNWTDITNFTIDSSATCLAVGSNKDIFLGMGNHIEVYNNQGKLLAKWKAFNEKSCITSVAIGEKDVFVADAANRLVLRYDLKGNFQNNIGKKDEQKGVEGFVIPSPYFDLGIDYFDNLWVVNPGKHQLNNFTESGNFRTAWGKTSTTEIDGFTGCCNPAQFCFGSDGSFITYEKKANRIKIYNHSGEFQCVVAPSESFTQFKSETNTDPLVKDLAVNSKGEILALEAASKGIRVFAKR